MFAVQSTRRIGSTPLFMSSSVANTTVATSLDGENAGVKLRAPRKKTNLPNHEGAGPVTAIHSIDEFFDAIENTQENELVIVK